MSGWEGSNPQGLVRDEVYIIHQLSLRQELAGTGLPLELQGELEFALPMLRQEPRRQSWSLKGCRQWEADP